MSEQLVSEMLVETGAVLDGHFLLTSGLHSGRFLLCSQLMQHPEQTGQICRLMAQPFAEAKIDTVIGPAMGGVILAYEVARYLKARAIFAEPLEKLMVLKRGFTVEPGERILVVEDAVSTGGSVQKVLDLLLARQVLPAGVSVIVDRSGGKVNFGLPYHALLSMDIPSYEPIDCPLCQAGQPLQRPKQ